MPFGVSVEPVEDLYDPLGAARGEHVVERLEPLAQFDLIERI